MGKPALSDLNAGLATAPVLFAAEMYPNDLSKLIDRKFKEDGDVDAAVDFVRKSDGIQRTKDLAQVHVEIAIEAIEELEQSDYRDSLIHLAHKVIDRTR
jgi:hexaprenyl-diphosphate synthase